MKPQSVAQHHPDSPGDLTGALYTIRGLLQAVAVHGRSGRDRWRRRDIVHCARMAIEHLDSIVARVGDATVPRLRADTAMGSSEPARAFYTMREMQSMIDNVLEPLSLCSDELETAEALLPPSVGHASITAARRAVRRARVDLDRVRAEVEGMAPSPVRR